MTIRALLLAATAMSAALVLTGCVAGASAPAKTPVESPAPPSSGAPQADLDAKLIAAAWANDVEEAAQLIEAGADVNAKDSTEQSAYLIATSEGYLPLLDLTLQHGADVTSLDSWDGTGLIRAAERGHAGIVGRLIQAGIDVDHVNNLGWVALHEALVFAKADAADDYVDTVRVLVAGGADVNIPAERDGLTPAQLTDEHGLQPQGELLRAAASLNGVEQADADQQLLAAARDGDADAAALALRAGADLETRNDREQTPLLLASTHDHVDVARLLVALGADPDALDHQHDTPWLVTGVTGSVAMLEALLPANPDMSIPNRYGGLSPIPAGERGHADYIARVVTTGVDLNHVNNLGWTALLEAVVFGDGSPRYVDLVTSLVEAGADVNIPDGNGTTALDHARAKGQTGVVRVLESAGTA
ncbi:ankyrin repeat domain-containing protein [Microbacterium sp. A196]|uniref:ankyrin repeat domain-containing protein n=1 Tax=unclassified Microbacterium TaxID=2609290 RepID=UPI003FD133A1